MFKNLQLGRTIKGMLELPKTTQPETLPSVYNIYSPVLPVAAPSNQHYLHFEASAQLSLPLYPTVTLLFIVVTTTP